MFVTVFTQFQDKKLLFLFALEFEERKPLGLLQVFCNVSFCISNRHFRNSIKKQQTFKRANSFLLVRGQLSLSFLDFFECIIKLFNLSKTCPAMSCLLKFLLL